MTPVLATAPIPTPVANGLDAAAGRLAGHVRDCLPWNELSRIPRDFEAFAAGHFRRRGLPGGGSWTDACPAYALAFLTHASYGPGLDEAATGELETQWQHLRGISRMPWPQALEIVQEAWLYLAVRQPR